MHYGCMLLVKCYQVLLSFFSDFWGAFKGRVSSIRLLPFVNTTFKLAPSLGSTLQKYHNLVCTK